MTNSNISNVALHLHDLIDETRAWQKAASRKHIQSLLRVSQEKAKQRKTAHVIFKRCLSCASHTYLFSQMISVSTTMGFLFIK